MDDLGDPYFGASKNGWFPMWLRGAIAYTQPHSNPQRPLSTTWSQPSVSTWLRLSWTFPKHLSTVLAFITTVPPFQTLFPYHTRNHWQAIKSLTSAAEPFLSCSCMHDNHPQPVLIIMRYHLVFLYHCRHHHHHQTLIHRCPDPCESKHPTQVFNLSTSITNYSNNSVYIYICVILSYCILLLNLSIFQNKLTIVQERSSHRLC